MKRSSLSVLFGVGVVTLGVGTWVAAERSGASGGHNGSVGSGGASCRDCHTGAEAGYLGINYAPLTYEAGASYDLEVYIFDSSKNGAGFQLSVEDQDGNSVGELVLADAVRTQFSSGSRQWVTHTATGVFDSVLNWESNSFSYRYPVTWIAPDADVGIVTFYAASCTIDDNQFETGDHVQIAQSSAVVPDVDCSAIEEVIAKCKRGRFKVIGKVKSSLPEGTRVTLSLDNTDFQRIAVDRRGKGTYAWRRATQGSHLVCLAECPDYCGETACFP